MKISEQSWHYRVNYWAYGKKFFFRWDHAVAEASPIYNGWVRKTVALCPYVDYLILAIVLSPFIVAGRLLVSGLDFLSENVQLVAVIMGLSLAESLLFGFVFPKLGWNAAFLVSFGTNWGLLGLFSLIRRLSEYYHAHHVSKPKGKKEEKPKEPKPVKVKKPRQPNILMEWLRARHRRICPFLEFEEATP